MSSATKNPSNDYEFEMRTVGIFHPMGFLGMLWKNDFQGEENWCSGKSAVVECLQIFLGLLRAAWRKRKSLTSCVVKGAAWSIRAGVVKLIVT